MAGAASAAVALVTAVVLHRDTDVVVPLPIADLQPSSEIYNSPAFDRLLGRPAQFTELSVSRNDQAAPVTELETAHDRIRVYRID